MKALPRKFSNGVLIISAVIAYLFWYYFYPVRELYAFYGSAATAVYFITKGVFALLVAVGFYNMILALTRALLYPSKAFLKSVYGKSYLRGEWVSFFRLGDEFRMVMYTFDQSMEDVKVKGVGYTTTGSLVSYSNWENVAFNVAGDVLTCGYVDNNIKRNLVSRGFMTLNLQSELNRKMVTTMFGSFYEVNADQVVNTVFYRLPEKMQFKNLSEKIAYINAEYTPEAARMLSPVEPDYYEPQQFDPQEFDLQAPFDPVMPYETQGFDTKQPYETQGFDTVPIYPQQPQTAPQQQAPPQNPAQPGQQGPPGYNAPYVAK